MATKIMVELLVDVPNDEASVYDAVNEMLRGHRRKHSPDSCLVDYRFSAPGEEYSHVKGTDIWFPIKTAWVED